MRAPPRRAAHGNGLFPLRRSCLALICHPAMFGCRTQAFWHSMTIFLIRTCFARLFTLDFPSYFPVMTHAKNRALREEMYRCAVSH